MCHLILSLRKNLAVNVRAARKAMNISQEEFAFRTDIDRNYASQIERAIANPSLGIISALGGVLGKSSAELLRTPELL